MRSLRGIAKGYQREPKVSMVRHWCGNGDWRRGHRRRSYIRSSGIVIVISQRKRPKD